MTESSVNLSLLKYQDQISPKAQPSRTKLNNSKSKVPEKMELSQQQQEVIQEIFNIITKHLNNPKIKMQELETLLTKQDLAVRNDMIFQLYTICDMNQDFAFNRKEFTAMFSNLQALQVYENYARDSIKKRLKKLRQNIRYHCSDQQFNDNALLSDDYQNFPMSLFGLFFCLAQKLVRNELRDFALNPDNKVSDRYDAMANIVKLLNVNDQLQQKEGNLDVELKDKMEKKYLQRFHSNQILQTNDTIDKTNPDYFQYVDSPILQNSDFYSSKKGSQPKFASQENFKSKISFMVSLAKVKGQADALFDHINNSELKELLTVRDSKNIKKKTQSALKLKFPTIEHTFNNENGLIRQQYKFLPKQKQQQDTSTMSQNSLKYCMAQKKKFSTIIPMLSERETVKKTLPSVHFSPRQQVIEMDDQYNRKNFCFLQKTNIRKAIFDNISAGIKPYRI